MALFNIDIEKFYKELESKGQTLKGIFCIQYPVYCIHANITDVTPDPLDNLDKLIVDFIISKPDFTPFQIASLIGTSKHLVTLRILKLITDKLLFKKEGLYKLTEDGQNVFNHKTLIRQHKQSFDFYLDGITLYPLPKIFYTYYRTKMISENDSYYHTNKRGETMLIQPFGPDLVHTTPLHEEVVNKILSIDSSNREVYSIPSGLRSIDSTAFTKMSFHVLVSVSSNGKSLIKELIDGNAIYSISDELSYYDVLRQNVLMLEENLKHRISQLEFKIIFQRRHSEYEVEPKPILSSNWAEIGKYDSSDNKCFSFSTEDLLKLMSEKFKIRNIDPNNIINENDDIEININKNMLLNSPNRQKLVGALIRKRDYTFGFENNNVFLLYLYYRIGDDFVRKVVEFKKLMSEYNKDKINQHWLTNIGSEYKLDYRRLLIAAGEFELLEKLDIEKFMIK
jgi:hypothetical protein